LEELKVQKLFRKKFIIKEKAIANISAINSSIKKYSTKRLIANNLIIRAIKFTIINFKKIE